MYYWWSRTKDLMFRDVGPVAMVIAIVILLIVVTMKYRTQGDPVKPDQNKQESDR